MQKQITVLVVDDSALIREMFTEMLDSAPDIRVIGTAGDPIEAREKIKQLNPDVLTLDIEMPKMDGISFLEKIMALRPMPVIMASTLTQRGAEATLRALEIGAVDIISKPVNHRTRDAVAALRAELIVKVRAAAGANLTSRAQSSGAEAIAAYSPAAGKPMPIIAMGSSTGGVEALREVFLRLPANCPPIVITQHMPESFTTSFAARLNSISQLQVTEASNHTRLKPGHAYIAPGGMQHLTLIKLGSEFVCKLEEGPTVSSHRPSVDVLFKSVAEAAGKRAIGVLLTGMGRDGAEGLKAIRDAGGYTIGQNAASCVVYGMPQVARKLGASCVELPLLGIPAALMRYAQTSQEAA